MEKAVTGIATTIQYKVKTWIWCYQWEDEGVVIWELKPIYIVKRSHKSHL